MPDNTQQEILEKIKKTHENIALSLGTILAMVLVIYFLTYSALANSQYTSLFWFEMLSSPVIVMALFYIRRIALFLTQLRFSRNMPYKTVLERLSLADL